MRPAALAALLATVVAALQPVAGQALWWPPGTYPDPPYFCLSQTRGAYEEIVTNDPQVGNNPEQDTFFGYAADPGWDDWYGYWAGDLNGKAGTVTGWVELFDHLYLGQSGHWNFSSSGWRVEGRLRQYIAYWNPYFDGQCGWWGGPPPYMADEIGVPVADFAVDDQPPTSPDPFVSDYSLSSVSFTWNPVVDQGSGAGADYFAVGFDHFNAWLTVDGGPPLQTLSTTSPRTLTAAALQAADTACVHVVAFDQLQNATPEQQACAGPATPPPAPPAPAAGAVGANPSSTGLTGLASWFWLAPAPAATTVDETIGGRSYRVVMTPGGVAWDFGDGSSTVADAGAAYPAESDVQHVYEASSRAGYPVSATLSWTVNWYVQTAGGWSGPYPMAPVASAASGLTYPVEQAQPELAGP